MVEGLDAAPVLRRIPGGWVGFHAGAAWPVRDPDGVAGHQATRWHFDGAALLAEAVGPAAPAPAAALPMPFTAQAPAPAPAPRAAPAIRTSQPAMPGMRLSRGAESLVVPRPWLERLLPMPALHPLPFAPPGVAGLALAGAAVLVLEGPADLPLLAVLRVEGRLIGLGCGEARPDAAPGDAAWLPQGLLALAPLAAEPAPARQEPTTPMLFCQAGGIAFALPALEVEAVLPPQRPILAPGEASAIRGVVAHRGQVLPVLDAGVALGGAAALAGQEVPMLRLAGQIAVAVTAVEGLRRVPLSAISPTSMGGPMRAVCWPGAAAVPVLDPAWLARGA